MSVRFRRFVGVFGLTLLPLGLVACSSDTTHLPALKDDPVANMKLISADLDRRWETPEGMGFLGKPTHADISMVYNIDGDTDADAAFDEVVEVASTAGWIFDPAGPDVDEVGVQGNRAYKQLQPGWATLSISANPERRTVYVHMDFGRDPPWSNGVQLSQGSKVIIPELSYQSYVTFDADSGDEIEMTIDPPDVGLDGVVLATPSGATLWSSDEVAGASEVKVGPITLDHGGTYITYVDLTAGNSGPVGVALSGQAESADMSLSIPSRSSISLFPVPGQDASIDFHGRAPQWFAMQVTASLEADHLHVAVVAPDGEPLWHDTQMRSTETGSIAYLDRIDLPTDGTYTINLDIDDETGPGDQVDVELFEPHGRNAFDETASWSGFEVPYQLGNDLYVPGSLDRWPLNGVQTQEIRIVAQTDGLTTTDGSEPGLALQVVAPTGETVWRGESADGELASDYLSLRDEGQYWLVIDGIGATIGHFTVAANACKPGRIDC